MDKLFFFVPALISFGPILMVIFGGKQDVPWEHLVGVAASLALSIGVLGLFMKIVHLEKKVRELQNK